MPQADTPTTRPRGSAREVFLAFLKLGLTSFGGPVAHLGYFREELIKRRHWLSEQGYADLIALCQFLPGPASSQVGFALGMIRGGFIGALLAWVAFTLPSAALLFGFAYLADAFGGPLGQSAIDGLKLVAVAVVAHAVWGMARNLCPDRTRALIALGGIAAVVFIPTAFGQIGAITLGALAGLVWCRGLQRPEAGHIALPLSRRAGSAFLVAFFALLGGLPLAVALWPTHALDLFEAFYRSGALVFGGGHVVLPLLESRVVETGWVSTDAFLSGYGAAQAIPGPLFTFSAYLGAVDANLGGLLGASIALLGIFLPGMLLLLGVLPFWDQLRQKRFAFPLMAGANAAVVGILAAALYQPVWTSAVRTPTDFLIAAAGFVLLSVWKLSPLKVVAGTVLASFTLGLIH
ncbi:chromate efflux transporter [Marinimicrobium sp. C6131]|uniref:chromate efflux transporter n=1 Tax=Marinimicrobium sp. C6131 TaxID=3022676 RepID=UPI00223E8BD1|nr:chromate efflux transporter [Marinimicrobium sp. C6131]UZJ43085.1 chromate efflux transporter [Marinimicrobium sp. C6131]